MKLVRCENGHFYDSEKYETCPHCGNDTALFYSRESDDTQKYFETIGKVHLIDDDIEQKTSKRKEVGQPREVTLPSELSLFRVQNLLGEGQTSKVFRIIPNGNYALKVVDITGQAAESAVDNEYRIARLLDDEKSFVGCCAMYKQDGKAYIVQPELQDLMSYLSREHSYLGRFFASLKILEDIAEAIMAMHNKGIIHLDVKPTNIFVDKDGHGKLGDFSISCEIDTFKKKPFRGGTPKYYPPEVYKAAGYSGKEDMYSFGITMYYILSGGKYPYDFGESVTRSADSEYITSVNIPDELQTIIKKATAYHPDDRYDSMQEICELLHLATLATRVSESCNSFQTSDYYEAEIANTCGWISIEENRSVTREDISDTEVPTSCDDQIRGQALAETLRRGTPVAVNEDGSVNTGSEASAVPSEQKLEISKVHFSAIAPKTLIKGDYTMIDIVMYQEAFRSVVDERINEAEMPVQETKSGVVKVKEGARVKIILSSPDITIEDNVEEQEWAGEYLTFNFAVMLPEKYAKRQVLFMATVYIDDVIATRLKFIAKCWSLRQQKIKVTQEDVLSAFVSYASQDRNRVAMIVQGMQKARPDMDIFFDVESLRSGESWEEALWSEIDQRDTLFLCWSRNAKESKWVDAEWRYAYAQKGIEAIEPIPLEPPASCPPPQELNEKHFNDSLLYVIKAESEGGDHLREGL